MSFTLLSALKKFALDLFETQIPEEANEVDTMAAINDAAASFHSQQNEKIAKVAEMQNEFASLQESMKSLTENHQKAITELNVKLDKQGAENAKKIDDLRTDLVGQLAKEKTDVDEPPKTTIGDDKNKSKVDMKAFSKNEPLKIKIG